MQPDRSFFNCLPGAVLINILRLFSAEHHDAHWEDNLSLKAILEVAQENHPLKTTAVDTFKEWKQRTQFSNTSSKTTASILELFGATLSFVSVDIVEHTTSSSLLLHCTNLKELQLVRVPDFFPAWKSAFQASPSRETLHPTKSLETRRDRCGRRIWSRSESSCPTGSIDRARISFSVVSEYREHVSFSVLLEPLSAL